MDLVNMHRLNRPVPEPAIEVATESEGPKYPHGLIINLSDEEIDRLPALAFMETDSIVHIVARGYIKEKSSEVMDDGDKKQRIEIQITQLAVAPDDAEAAFNEGGGGSGEVPGTGKTGHSFPGPSSAPGPGSAGTGGGAP